MKSDGKQLVGAKELYRDLGFNKNNYKRWYEKNITKNPFAIENEDFTVLLLKRSTDVGGQLAQDFALTLDFAKRLAMLARTEKGEEIRKYFVKCEEIAKGSAQIAIEQPIKAYNKLGIKDQYLSISAFMYISEMSADPELQKRAEDTALEFAKESGIEPRRVADSAFGWINSFPNKLIIDVFNSFIH